MKANSVIVPILGTRIESVYPALTDLTYYYSTNSIDDLIAAEGDGPPDAWISDLNTRMEQIIDRKRSSVQGREESLNGFSYLLMAHYSQEEIKTKIGELVPAILKSVKAGQSEKETILGLKGKSQTCNLHRECSG